MTGRSLSGIVTKARHVGMVEVLERDAVHGGDLVGVRRQHGIGRRPEDDRVMRKPERVG